MAVLPYREAIWQTRFQKYRLRPTGDTFLTCSASLRRMERVNVGLTTGVLLILVKSSEYTIEILACLPVNTERGYV